MRLSASLLGTQLELEVAQSRRIRRQEKGQMKACQHMEKDAASSTCEPEVNEELAPAGANEDKAPFHRRMQYFLRRTFKFALSYLTSDHCCDHCC